MRTAILIVSGVLLLAGAAPAFGQYYPSGAPINPSDTPSVWAQVRNSDGAIGSVWEAESPTSEHDDRAPMSARSGYTLVNAGVPSLPVLEAVYADILTATERTGALANLNRYLLHREWVTAPLTALSQYNDPGQVPVDKRRSARHWMLRFAASPVLTDPCIYRNVGRCLTGAGSSFLGSNLVVVDGA